MEFQQITESDKHKSRIIFPDGCYLRVSSQNSDNGAEQLIYSQETLKTALDTAPGKRVEAVIEEGDPPTTTLVHRCVISYYDAYDTTSNVNKKGFSFSWDKGEDFEVDEFLDDLVNGIQCEIDFENDDIGTGIDKIDDLFDSSKLELYYCETHDQQDNDDNLSIKNCKDDIEDLMVNLNEEDDIQDVYFVLKRVRCSLAVG